MKKHKIETERICVTMPKVLLEHYRATAEETGMSVSKVILATLRSKGKNVILLPMLYVKYVEKLNAVIASAIAANTVTPELKQQIATLEYLARRADILVEKKGVTYHGKT